MCSRSCRIPMWDTLFPFCKHLHLPLDEIHYLLSQLANDRCQCRLWPCLRCISSDTPLPSICYRQNTCVAKEHERLKLRQKTTPMVIKPLTPPLFPPTSSYDCSIPRYRFSLRVQHS